MAFPGYTAPQAMVLGAGVILVGSTPIGATRGGARFTPGVEMDYPDFDGSHTEVAGLHSIGKYNAEIVCDFLTLSDAAISTLFAGSSSDGSANNLFTMKPAGEFLVTGDYLTNLKWIGPQQDSSTENLIITFARALAIVNSLQTRHRDQGLINVTFRGVLDINASNLKAAPHTITKAAT